jgi:putative oxidoreductase
MAAPRELREPIAATIVERLDAGTFGWRIAMTLDRFGATYQPLVLSLFRFVTGLLLLQYGIAKIFKFPALPYFANPPPLIMTAGGLELVLGVLLMVGLFTRPVAFILSGEMAFAYFLGHMFKTGEAVFHPLNNGGTAAILFCFACLYLSVSGGGSVSVDAVLQKRNRVEHAEEGRFGQAAE